MNAALELLDTLGAPKGSVSVRSERMTDNRRKLVVMLGSGHNLKVEDVPTKFGGFPVTVERRRSGRPLGV